LDVVKPDKMKLIKQEKLTVQNLQYLALDEPQSPINSKLTKKPITFHYSINQKCPAPIPRVHLLIIAVSLFFKERTHMCACTHTHPHNVILCTDEKEIENVTGKTGQHI
jgi:hypothetical protein